MHRDMFHACGRQAAQARMRMRGAIWPATLFMPECRAPGRAQGDVLAVSPYESHLDERLFGAGAAAYDPGRLPLRLAGGAVPGVGGLAGLVFGGGRYRCGRGGGLGVHQGGCCSVSL